MTDKEKEAFKENIKKAIKISSQKFIQKQRLLGEKVVVSINGKIKLIDP
jgi:hypothetical protein